MYIYRTTLSIAISEYWTEDTTRFSITTRSFARSLSVAVSAKHKNLRPKSRASSLALFTSFPGKCVPIQTTTFNARGPGRAGPGEKSIATVVIRFVHFSSPQLASSILTSFTLAAIFLSGCQTIFSREKEGKKEREKYSILFSSYKVIVVQCSRLPFFPTVHGITSR